MNEIIEMEGCQDNPQKDLLTLLENDNFDEFEAKLLNGISTESVDIDHRYVDAKDKTLLEIACSSSKTRYVALLLRCCADVNLLNSVHRTAPIHWAVLHSNFDTVKVLVDHEDIDIRTKNSEGKTALSLAAQRKRKDCIRLLQEHQAEKIKKARKNILITPDSFRSEVRRYNDNMAGDETDDSKLTSSLRHRNYDAFASEANVENVNRIDKNLGWTYLQYACRFGFIEFVQLLLNLEADPNRTTDSQERTPIVLAASQGYHDIVQLLLDTGIITFDLIGGENILHFILCEFLEYKISKECHTGEPGPNGPSDNPDHTKCLKLILNKVPDDELDVDRPGNNNFTPLGMAIVMNNREVILSLLERGAYIGQACYAGALIKIMNPVTLEYFLNAGVVYNNAYSDFMGSYNSVTFDFNLITCERALINEMKCVVAVSKEPKLRPLLKHPFFMVFLDCKWHIITRKIYYTIVSFYLQFVVGFSAYLLATDYVASGSTHYVASNSTHHAASKSTHCVASKSNHYVTTNSTDYVASNSTDHVTSNITDYVTSNVTHYVISNSTDCVASGSDTIWASTLTACLWYLIWIDNCILLSKEIILLNYSKANVRKYLTDPGHWTDITLVIIIWVILHLEIPSNHIRGLLVVAAIFISYVHLMLMILNHPRLTSVHVEMFKTVAANAWRFLAAYSLIILAFTFNFHLLIKDSGQQDNAFNNITRSVFKTVIMSMGEDYEVSKIVETDRYGISVIFLLFLFFVPIVLLNLLNAIAVSDIQNIRQDAELVSLVARAKLMEQIEDVVIAASLFFDQLALQVAKFYDERVRRRSKARKIGSLLLGAYFYNYSVTRSLYRHIHYFPRAPFPGPSNICFTSHNGPEDIATKRIRILPASERAIREMVSAQSNKADKVDCHDVAAKDTRDAATSTAD